MRFCPTCENLMEQIVDDSGVGFVCRHDGTTIAHRPQDLRLGGGGGEGHSTRVADLHRATLRHAASDPTTARVARPCPECKLPYLRQVIVGERSASAFYVCTCGYKVSAKDYGRGGEPPSSEKELAALERAGWEKDGVEPPAKAPRPEPAAAAAEPGGAAESKTDG